MSCEVLQGWRTEHSGQLESVVSCVSRQVHPVFHDIRQPRSVCTHKQVTILMHDSNAGGSERIAFTGGFRLGRGKGV